MRMGPTLGGWVPNWPLTSASAPRRTCTTRWARTGPSRRGSRPLWPRRRSSPTATCCGRSCATAGSAGRSHPGFVPAVVDSRRPRPVPRHLRVGRPRGHGRHPAAGGGARGRCGGRGGPGDRRAMDPGRHGRSGDPRNRGPMVPSETTRGCVRPVVAHRCVASVTVHDLPPTAGYVAGEHIALRESLGLLAGRWGRRWSMPARSMSGAACSSTKGFPWHKRQPRSTTSLVALHRCLAASSRCPGGRQPARSHR